MTRWSVTKLINVYFSYFQTYIIRIFHKYNPQIRSFSSSSINIFFNGTKYFQKNISTRYVCTYIISVFTIFSEGTTSSKSKRTQICSSFFLLISPIGIFSHRYIPTMNWWWWWWCMHHNNTFMIQNAFFTNHYRRRRRHRRRPVAFVQQFSMFYQRVVI